MAPHTVRIIDLSIPSFSSLIALASTSVARRCLANTIKMNPGSSHGRLFLSMSRPLDLILEKEGIVKVKSLSCPNQPKTEGPLAGLRTET